jgi:hypothetical protein
MGTTDIVSAVGTWIAVGLATVALLGVVGPLLVWRASKTARNQGLAGLDRGYADSSGFVTKGFSFGREIRLFRRVRAPNLRDPPKVQGRKPVWDGHASLPPKESAGWVQLGATIRAYSFSYERGEFLTFHDGQAMLTVSYIWLIIIGLSGRFGLRQDHGKWPTQRPKGVTFDQAIPGSRLRGAYPPIQRLYTAVPGDFKQWADDYRNYGASSALHGLVGTIKNARYGDLKFQAHQQQDIGELSEELLDMAALFWLAVGCLPTLNGTVVYCLEDVQFQSADLDSHSSDDGDAGTTKRYHQRRVSVRTQDADFESEEHASSDDMRRVRRPSYISSGHYRSNDRTPRMLCFATTQERVEGLLDLANAVGAESTGTLTMSLIEVSITQDVISALQDDAGRTFVPCDRQWIRLVHPAHQDPHRAVFFLDRADAQRLARTLLQLPICAQGYLVYRPPESSCRAMLVECCELLPRLLSFILADFDVIRSPGKKWESHFLHLTSLFRLTQTFSYKRTFARALYDVDCILHDLAKHAPIARLAVQVLAITNPEFRDLISQSVRTLRACLTTSLVVNISASAVYVSAAFGVVKQFPIDVDVLVDEASQDISSLGQIVVPYKDVLFLVLKASLRSTFLKTSLDSAPLFDWIMRAGETIELA